jgi:hypothetical protein
MELIAIALGVALLLWLPFEDSGIDVVLAFSTLICGWCALRFLLSIPPGRENWLRRYVFAGALAGLAVSPLAFLLMALKTGLHGHPSPDFTVGQLREVLASTPLWLLAGLLLGFGSGLWRATRRAEDGPGA